MKIAGFTTTSFIDYPGYVSAVIFLAGCNYRCPYCHNPELINPPADQSYFSFDKIVEELRRRKKLLDGVVFLGGEPTLHKELSDMAETVKELGYKVKVDTNGSNPELMAELIQERQVDYVAMDFKLPFNRYIELATDKLAADKVRDTIKILRDSEIEYEFRTTVMHPFVEEDDLLEIMENLQAGEKWYLQNYTDIEVLDPEFAKTAEPWLDEELAGVVIQAKKLGIACFVR